MANEYNVYVGTYAEKESSGIHVYSLEESTSEWKSIQQISGITNPSFLALSASGDFLYAASEMEQYLGQASGAVVSYKIDSVTGQLTYLNEQLTLGGSSCHLSIDSSGKFLVVANYSGANICLFPIELDGSIGAMADLVSYEGRGLTNRQEASHPHSVTWDPNKRYVFLCDLGLDVVKCYVIDESERKLKFQHEVKLPDGAGPRHMVFHKELPFAYVVNELDSTVSVFQYEQEQGRLLPLEHLSTLPEGFADNTSFCADIHISPSGEVLLASNRGHDSLAVFRIDQTTGRLTSLGYVSTEGKIPRNFAITPSGQYVIAANQTTDSVVTFRWNEEEETFSESEPILTIPKPVCIVMQPKK